MQVALANGTNTKIGNFEMNERIKELVAQVEKYISTTNFEGMPEDEMTYDEIFQKKFAELIVRECAEVAQDFVTAENNKLVETIHISPWRLQDKIKEHFGVEE